MTRRHARGGRGSPGHQSGAHHGELALPTSSPEVNGWTLFAHPLFLSQITKLDAAARAEAPSFSAGHPGPNTKLLAHLLDLAFFTIPENPKSPAFRQGDTLGQGYKHWFRAKTGNGRYRLFFRYSEKRRVILYAWVNDAESLRTYSSRTDAYAVFASMLDAGDPPDDWDALVAGAETDDARAYLAGLFNGRRQNRSGPR